MAQQKKYKYAHLWAAFIIRLVVAGSYVYLNIYRLAGSGIRLPSFYMQHYFGP